MEQFYLNLTKSVTSTAGQIWSYLPFLLLAVGLRLTIKTGFIQFRRLRRSSQFFGTGKLISALILSGLFSTFL